MYSQYCLPSELLLTTVLDVISPKKVTATLTIQMSDTIGDVKRRIRNSLDHCASRLTLNDKPLDDALLVRDSGSLPRTYIRAARGKQIRKKRRINHGPGSNQRRKMKAQQSQERLKKIVAQMSSQEKIDLAKQLAEYNERKSDDTEVYSLPNLFKLH